MSKRAILFLVIVTFVWISCQSNHLKKSKNEDLINFIDNEKDINKKLEGFWILTNYYDSIIKDKSISKHRIYPISWSAMTLQIKKDTMLSNGLLYIMDRIKIQTYNDTLCFLDTYGKFLFTYDKKRDCIAAIEISSNKSKYKGKHFIYRRISENRLLKIIKQNDSFKIATGFYQLFIDSLIAGEYKSISNGNTLILNSDGSMIGFKQFTNYQIHDYFGTYHPFNNIDAICFEDSRFNKSKNSLSSPSNYFNWSFSDDTLTFIELITENNDDYQLGEKTYKFIRIKK